MYLTPSQQRSANKKRTLIKNHCEDIRLCNQCNGTGLGNIHRTSDGDYSWDGESFCDKCKGIGYLEFKETLTMKLCPLCKGGGWDDEMKCQCSKCKGEGVLDWIQFMKGGR